MNDKESKKYEVGFLVKDEEGKEEVVRILKNRQSSIINDGEISKVKLAYPIKKEGFAYFGYLHFSCVPESVKELRNEFKFSPKILRFIIISRPAPIKSSEIKNTSEEVYHQSTLLKKHTIKEIPRQQETLSNKDLEKKLEEILK